MKSSKAAKCSLCGSQAKVFFEEAQKVYHQCAECSAIFLDPGWHVSREEERKRYEEHNNDVEDVRYQEFVRPIVSGVERKFGKEHRGLDFGAGTGPVISKLLRDKGYTIELYDPFFWNDPQKLEERYDFIACCEVMEHFHSPAEEFKLLRSLLKPRGALFCMTNLYSENIVFDKWYYKNDPTHVFFYHRNTLAWIKTRFDFSVLEIEERLVQFSI